MEKHQRDKLLAKIEREGATVGHSIPEVISIDGEELELSKLVFNIQDTRDIPEDSFESLKSLKQVLRQERNSRVDTIEAGDISYSKGEQLVEEIIGIDRALHLLENLGGDTSIEKQSEVNELKRTKKWREFVQKIQE